MIIYGAFSSVVEWCRCYCYAGNLTVHAVAYFCYLCWCSQFHWRHRGDYGFQYLPMICTVMLCSTVRSTKHYRVYRGVVGDNAIPWLYFKAAREEANGIKGIHGFKSMSNSENVSTVSPTRPSSLVLSRVPVNGKISAKSFTIARILRFPFDGFDTKR